MKTKHIAGLSVALCAVAAAVAKDPIIMTVNGVDVPRSEFEYLYHKNSQQQAVPQSIDEYVEMFKIYKMKVADARAMGLDTTASFKKELGQYTAELAQPYLVDSTYIYKYVQEAYERGKNEVEFNHIMLLKPRGGKTKPIRQRADSIRTLLLNGANFEQLAAELSEDKSAKANHGHVGYVTPGRLPYAMEMAAYETPAGQYSEVVESPVGFHIIMGGEKRPSRGTRLAAHIMKAVPRFSDKAAGERAKAQIDSLYQLAIANPDSFSALASANSDDKGSAQQGGMLPWFGAGEMVPQFDAVAFGTEPGQISEPFRTDYGWHIVKVLDAKPYGDYERIRPGLVKIVSSPGDERVTLIRRDQTEAYAKKRNVKRNEATYAEIRNYVAANGVDSAFYDKYGKPSESPVLFSVDKAKFTVADYLAGMNNYHNSDPEEALPMLESTLDRYYSARLQAYELMKLEEEQPDYRNLMNEFREGSLLYEASVARVWDKAAKDTAGLQNYFDTHRQDYAWKEPHVKGYLVQAMDDSVAARVRQRMEQLPADSLVTTIRAEFPKKQVLIEKVLVAQGANPMVDNLMFGGPQVQPSSSMLTTYFLFDPVVLTEPEEVSDVRGLVTSDYQNQLEREWVEELRVKYPVTVNEKELKKIK